MKTLFLLLAFACGISVGASAGAVSVRYTDTTAIARNDSVTTIRRDLPDSGRIRRPVVASFLFALGAGLSAITWQFSPFMAFSVISIALAGVRLVRLWRSKRRDRLGATLAIVFGFILLIFSILTIFRLIYTLG